MAGVYNLHPMSGGLALYGDGSDGDVTYSGNTTLTDDVFAENVTVEAGVVVRTGGFRIFVRDTLTIAAAGVIHDDGNDASGATEGAVLAAAGALQTSGRVGGAGRATAGAGNAGNGISNSLGGSGGAGGQGDGSNAGGAGGTSSAPASTVLDGVRTGAVCFRLFGASSVANINGGSGGGGGGCNPGTGTATSGGGGGGARSVIVAARRINNAGRITARGGAGGAAAATGDGAAGGGGGGGGGVVVVIYDEAVGSGLGTVDAAGGAGGAGAGGGAAGSAGSAGMAVTLRNREA